MASRRLGRPSPWCAATVLVAIAWLPPLAAARADEAASQRAERLFREALSLVRAGDYPGACPLLDESERLEHAIGTAFDLADCYEHTGKLATALDLFLRVQREATVAGKAEREKIAQTRATALATRVAQLDVTLAEAAPSERVLLDGTDLPTAPPAALPVDAGTHTLSASAPGRKIWSMSVDIADGEHRALTVPTLEAEAPAVGLARTGGRASVVAEVPRASSASTQKTVAIVSAGAGAAGLLAGAVAGVVSLIAHDHAQEECPKDKFHFRCPTQAGADDWNVATNAGTASTVGFVVAGACVGLAVTLWLTAPSGRSTAPRSTGLEPLPLLGPHLGGAALKGSF
jgi:hypothetical protein